MQKVARESAVGCTFQASPYALAAVSIDAITPRLLPACKKELAGLLLAQFAQAPAPLR